MTLLTALYDASVLYPSLTRNLLIHLATSGLVAARWTEPRTNGPGTCCWTAPI